MNRFRRMITHWMNPSPALLPSKAAYGRWAKTYPPFAHNRFMEIEEATLLKLMPPLEGKHILDLACGSGRWGKLAAERGAAQVISLDESPAMLKSGHPANALEGLMTQIPLRAACVEVVICGLAVGHVVTPRLWATLAEIKRVLTAGGIALISDVHPVQMWSGGQRTFQDGSSTIAIEHYIHSYADYHAAAKQLGLTITAVQEVSAALGEPPVLLALQLTRSD